MAARPAKRPAIGAAAWCAEERSSALQITQSESEEFSYSARNELEWLNEHMAEIFSNEQMNVADIFKTPGKLRGKTPRTARKLNNTETRVPLSNIFSATPKGAPNPFTTFNSQLAKTPTFKIAEDVDVAGSPAKAASEKIEPDNAKPVEQKPVLMTDSGYYGSQSQDAVPDMDTVMEESEPLQHSAPERSEEVEGQVSAPLADATHQELPSSATSLLKEASQSAEEERTTATGPETGSDGPRTESSAMRQSYQEMRREECLQPQVDLAAAEPEQVEYGIGAQVAPSSPVQLLGNDTPDQTPTKSLHPAALPENSQTVTADPDHIPDTDHETVLVEDEEADVTRSPSDGSSPIRPLVRKSSLNFASLPAREPLTSNKSMGTRMSRTSHIDQTRTSYYPRQTGGKSIGVRQDELQHDEDAMDIDDATDLVGEKDSLFTTHGKSYTQRLQDQISMLGKSQASGARPSESIHSLAGARSSYFSTQAPIAQPVRATVFEEKMQSPTRYQQVARTPGAFPADDEDDWIAPPTTTKKLAFNPSPRPGLDKSFSADVMEGLRGKSTVDDMGLDMRREELDDAQPESPLHSPQKPPISHPGQQVAGHGKSVSVPDMRQNIFGTVPGPDVIRKTVSVSNPAPEHEPSNNLAAAPMSPTKSIRHSPTKHNALKQVKNKFSSILKGSKGLLASSAALSAETKASLRGSPSLARMHSHFTKSAESLAPESNEKPLYPDLSKHVPSELQPTTGSTSLTEANSRKTRASSERDRRDQKQKDKEDKEAQRLAEQLDKLEKARELEREKARIFNQQKQEQIAADKQAVKQKEQEKNTRTPAPKGAPKLTRTSPRKAQPAVKTRAEREAAAGTSEDELAEMDVEMAGLPAAKPTPSIPRPIATPGQTMNGKRPTKPTREPTLKVKQAPTLIRVNTSSQHGGFHPSNSSLSSNLHETLNSSQQHVNGKALQTKASVQSFSSSINSTTGRPKALDLADKRRQEEERKEKRKREVKAEMERKREEARRQEDERRQRERQREEDAKKAAARQAAIDRAKQTRAPPAALHRSQPIGLSGNNSVRVTASASRPPSRLAQTTMQRSQDDSSRPVNAVLSTASKMSMKRPLQQDGAEDGASRPAGARGGPAQQSAKRMRMSDEFGPDEEIEIQSYGTSLKGPPVRPSAGFKKDQPHKSVFASGYGPAPQSVSRDIFKAPPVAAHHSKSGHPMDMAQISKGHIPFATNQQGAGASLHKTPARPAGVMAAKSAAKSAKRSSPRFQNGDNIELPEIQTDDEDDDEDDEAKGLGTASWADTPELRRELMRQETLDPLQVFGPPAPLNMQEVFKNKDRWKTFRSRGSSANWGGTDRLTEEEIRKDMAAREKMRRDGGWSYELGKDMR